MKGQMVLIIILVIATALGIGLAVVQRSLTDIQTSTKIEESSRAFSAAEGGIERALRTGSSEGGISLGGATADVNVQPDLPAAQQPLEYPPITKEEIAHVWLADPQTLNKYYDQPYLEIAWGATNISSADDKPAIEVSVVYSAGGIYQSKKFYFDSNATRTSSNGFQDISGNCSNTPVTFSTSMGANRIFYCRNSISLSGITPTLMLLRARILYSNSAQPFAVLPWGGGSLPQQAKLFTSTGVAGQSQRRVQLFKLDKVVPFYFDYGLFSSGTIEK